MKTRVPLLSRHAHAFWKGFLLAIVVALLLTACKRGAVTSSTQTPPTNTTTGPTSTVAPRAIKTMVAVTLSGTQTVLANDHGDRAGFTLYFFELDTPTTSACTDTCAQTWLPFLFLGPGQPRGVATVDEGKVTVVPTANGMQVAYNGHLLYNYQGDPSARVAEGDWVDQWHVATPRLLPPPFALLVCYKR